MSADSPDKDLRALLQAVEADATRTSPNRDRIKQSVLATFDEAVGSSVEEDEPPNLIELNPSVDERRTWMPRTRVIGWMATAAAILLVLVVVSEGRERLDTSDPANTETVGEQRLAVDGSELPARLLPGPQTTDRIAGGLSFEAPEGLAVITEDDGQIVLTVADDPGDNSGLLVIVETEPSDWETELEALQTAGDVSIKEVAATVGGQPTIRRDVTVTDQAASARACTVGEPCLRLDGWPDTGPAALWAGADNRIVEIGRTDDAVVLAIETSQRFTGPLSRLAAEVVNTATLSAE
ncbi:MAG: hypothetical protein OES24_07145 [Acidimicrobiia bacterium]|nr:hypothetical protein [Acidimicrobiia bacterium]